MDTPTSASSPIVWGARSISIVIGKTPRATLHMLERGVLPARKVGGQWAADRDALLAFLRGVAATTAA